MADSEVIRDIIFDLDTEVKRLGMKLRIARSTALGAQQDPQHENDFQAEPDALAAPYTSVRECEEVHRKVAELTDVLCGRALNGAPTNRAGDHPSAP